MTVNEAIKERDTEKLQALIKTEKSNPRCTVYAQTQPRSFAMPEFAHRKKLCFSRTCTLHSPTLTVMLIPRTSSGKHRSSTRCLNSLRIFDILLHKERSSTKVPYRWNFSHENHSPLFPAVTPTIQSTAMAQVRARSTQRLLPSCKAQ